MAGGLLRTASTALLMASLVLTLGCEARVGAAAPVEAGVCWRLDVQPRGRPVFMPVAPRAPDLLSCAADLDIVYLNDGAPVTGAYQGHYIFVGPAAIESAERLDLIRYPVFNIAQRASLDHQLRAVLAARVRSIRPQG